MRRKAKDSKKKETKAQKTSPPDSLHPSLFSSPLPSSLPFPSSDLDIKALPWTSSSVISFNEARLSPSFALLNPEDHVAGTIFFQSPFTFRSGNVNLPFEVYFAFEVVCDPCAEGFDFLVRFPSSFFLSFLPSFSFPPHPTFFSQILSFIPALPKPASGPWKIPLLHRGEIQHLFFESWRSHHSFPQHRLKQRHWSLHPIRPISPS